MNNAGKYNKKITIVSSSNAHAAGFVNVKDPATFSKVLDCWAEIKTTSGYTLFTSHTDFEKAVTRFTIRKPPVEIARDMFILFNDRIFAIRYVNDIDYAGVELELQAEAVTK